MISVKISRYSKSYKFKRNPNAADDWGNNDANNSLDDFEVYEDGKLIATYKVQSVSNIPGGRFLDTIAPGKFQLKLFVEQRSFWPEIHGIINAFDLEGQQIDGRSIEPIVGKDGAPIDFARWLVHDWQKHRDQRDANGKLIPQGSDTRVAWSAGCQVLADRDLVKFNTMLRAKGYKSGDAIDVELVNID
jgi:hypothetical protein